MQLWIILDRIRTRQEMLGPFRVCLIEPTDCPVVDRRGVSKRVESRLFPLLLLPGMLPNSIPNQIISRSRGSEQRPEKAHRGITNGADSGQSGSAPKCTSVEYFMVECGYVSIMQREGQCTYLMAIYWNCLCFFAGSMLPSCSCRVILHALKFLPIRIRS